MRRARPAASSTATWSTFSTWAGTAGLLIVMELLDGKTLAALLRVATLTVGELPIIVLRAMEGVAAAHAQGVVHRDLKPDNIFVCVASSGRLDDPRVLDFGISRQAAISAIASPIAA